ncbi:MAG TPA: enoyl-CoA hydratase [Solirubrobacteraceae bacterium]|jgi:2-(1,2-epoxy-1,2-dihydrophenyl)acetyl-CoA isomerase
MSNWELEHAYETVNLHRRGHAARIELNRPEALNAWNKQFGVDLLAAVKAVTYDDDVRAVLITGAGRGFSSGADLKAGFDPVPGTGKPDVHTTLTERYHPIMIGLREMPKPVVTAVQGPAVGIGCSLALVADLIIAAESAYFLLAFVNIGLVPDGGSSVFLPARIGFTRAIEMAMLGERIPASQALEWGLVNRVHPDGELEAAADELIDRLAAGPTGSYAGTKRQINRWVYAGMHDQLALEADIQQERAGSDDFLEGVTAFVEKRQARFSGR